MRTEGAERGEEREGLRKGKTGGRWIGVGLEEKGEG